MLGGGGWDVAACIDRPVPGFMLAPAPMEAAGGMGGLGCRCRWGR